MAGYNYKRLLSEKSFLKVQLRARALMQNGADLLAIYYAEKRLVFRVASGTYGKRVIYTVTLELDDADLANLQAAKRHLDVEAILKTTNIRVHCTCPAFHYWGYKYMAWKRGYGLEKEVRRPVIRNPHEQGYVCKHLYLVLSLYPFWVKSLASKFKKWADKKTEGMPTLQGNNGEGQSWSSARMNKSNRKYVNQLTNPNRLPEGTSPASNEPDISTVTGTPEPSQTTSTTSTTNNVSTSTDNVTTQTNVSNIENLGHQ